MKRTAEATWLGGLKEGKGRLTTASHVLSEARYSFGTRFADETGTNPEELIAAAHAGCFSMALALLLGNAGMSPESIRTVAELTLENGPAGWTITGINLRVSARVPGASAADFDGIAEQAKTGCLVSRLLNTHITLDGELEPAAER